MPLHHQIKATCPLTQTKLTPEDKTDISDTKDKGLNLSERPSMVCPWSTWNSTGSARTMSSWSVMTLMSKFKGSMKTHLTAANKTLKLPLLQRKKKNPNLAIQNSWSSWALADVFTIQLTMMKTWFESRECDHARSNEPTRMLNLKIRLFIW